MGSSGVAAGNIQDTVYAEMEIYLTSISFSINIHFTIPFRTSLYRIGQIQFVWKY